MTIYSVTMVYLYISLLITQNGMEGFFVGKVIQVKKIRSCHTVAGVQASGRMGTVFRNQLDLVQDVVETHDVT